MIEKFGLRIMLTKKELHFICCAFREGLDHPGTLDY